MGKSVIDNQNSMQQESQEENTDYIYKGSRRINSGYSRIPNKDYGSSFKKGIEFHNLLFHFGWFYVTADLNNIITMNLNLHQCSYQDYDSYDLCP